MPEGDTLFNTALMLRPALVGASLTAVSVRARGMYRLRVGDVVGSVEAVGKFLEIVVERGLALRTHLHMTGVWHLYEHGERWRRPRHLARVVLETDAPLRLVADNLVDVEHFASTHQLFGLDASDPGFWAKGLAVIEGLIDELERMA